MSSVGGSGTTGSGNITVHEGEDSTTVELYVSSSTGKITIDSSEMTEIITEGGRFLP